MNVGSRLKERESIHHRQALSDQETHFLEAQKKRQRSAKKVLKAAEQLASTPSESGESFLSADELAQKLFKKAPIAFLENRSLEELIAITKKAHSVLDKHGGDPKKVEVCYERRKDCTAYYIVMGDRSFIVNSIAECARNAGYTMTVLSHPILAQDGIRTSVCYLEIDELSEEKALVFQRHIKSSLSDLVLVTEDFTSMLVRVETLARVLDDSKIRSSHPRLERKEVADFLRWLTDGGLLFLGYLEWRFDDNEELKDEPETKLGIYKTVEPYLKELLQESFADSQRLAHSGELLLVTKFRLESMVHRKSRINDFAVLELSPSGQPLAIHSIAGFLTSKALAQESSSVPLIRRKLNRLLEIEDVVENSHDHKMIIDIVDSMPKEEVLRLDIDELRGIIHTVLGDQNKNSTRVSIRFDHARRGASLLIVMPRDRFNTDVRNKLQNHIEHVFHAAPGSSEYHLDLSDQPLVKVFFYIPIGAGEIPPVDLSKLQLDIVDFTRTWSDNLEQKVLRSQEFETPADIWHRYGNAFPIDYQALQSVEDCEYDIGLIETLNDDNPVCVGFASAAEHADQIFTLIVYSLKRKITLSQAVPILENVGFEVIDERSSEILPRSSGNVFVHRFIVRPSEEAVVNKSVFEDILAPGLSNVFIGLADNDELNELMFTAHLNSRAVELIRTYCSFLWQLNTFTSRQSIIQAFTYFPSLAVQFWGMFEIAFNPAVQGDSESRRTRFDIAYNAYIDNLREVSEISKDRVLRAAAQVLRSTVRTNFYSGSETIVIKIHSESADLIPPPRPLFEVFMRSPRIEGIHLRTGFVARGGIRWSDRYEDFRSEVLGLMKTQKIKNSLIVPTGAKGGFVVRELPEDRAEVKGAVENAYREFIRGLLSICDNRDGDRIVKPEELILYDGDDPYFVVAADKGTATFSDIANKVAEHEFAFWLADAFASGGSAGYDHKLYGITARGAWECVKRHFNDSGLPWTEQAFTVVGIGDMSGDVFGNGMLLSKNIKLVASFNHQHIFIDPNPDPEKSFEERNRLFQLQGSQWTDYRSEYISKGGGVFGRYDKEITLSPEIRAALSIPDDAPETVNGEQLVVLILQAEVDLLWNGGIGTYVKSRYESHAEVGDGSNDRVRVNADQLRAKVVGEGGNLGFTQRARIEFSQNGGLINTDSIDNSGGVDLSDHEVNLKILFSTLMQEGVCTRDERNQMLREMAPEVIEQVLEHNRSHALVLTIGRHRSRKNIDYFRTLIKEVHTQGYIDRNLEYLPSDEELRDQAQHKLGLSRPELAVCLSAVKLWVKDVLMQSDLPKDPLLESFIVDYFPERLRKHREAILSHPLAHNIAATQIVNHLIDTVGITFVHRMCLNHSVHPVTVVKCALAAEILLDITRICSNLSRFDTIKDNRYFLGMRRELSRTLRDATSWLILHHGDGTSLEEMVQCYRSDYQTLRDNVEQFLVGDELEIYSLRLENFAQQQLDTFTSRSLALFPRIVSLFDMLWTARSAETEVEYTAIVYSSVMDELEINLLLQLESEIESKNKWESELLVNCCDSIRSSVSSITRKLLESGIHTKEKAVTALHDSESYEQYRATLTEIKESYQDDVAALSVISKLLNIFKLP